MKRILFIGMMVAAALVGRSTDVAAYAAPKTFAAVQCIANCETYISATGMSVDSPTTFTDADAPHCRGVFAIAPDSLVTMDMPNGSPKTFVVPEDAEAYYGHCVIVVWAVNVSVKAATATLEQWGNYGVSGIVMVNTYSDGSTISLELSDPDHTYYASAFNGDCDWYDPAEDYVVSIGTFSPGSQTQGIEFNFTAGTVLDYIVVILNDDGTMVACGKFVAG